MRRAYHLLALAFALVACAETRKLGPTPALGTLAGAKSRLDEVATAVAAVQAIYADPTFWKLLEKRRWIAGKNASTSISGAEVHAVLAQVRPADQMYEIEHVGFWSHLPLVDGAANASTRACARGRHPPGGCGRIAISIDHFPWKSAWYLINTVAHENTHTIGDRDGPCGCGNLDNADSLYTDTGGDSLTDTTMVWLVSYAIGDLAECFARAQRNEIATWSCFDDKRNGDRCNRRIVECCPGDADTAATIDARAHTPACDAIAPICPKPGEVSCSYGRGA
jgi:hypothetical protein